MSERTYEIDNVCGHTACPAWKRQKLAEVTVRFFEERLDQAYQERRDARAAYMEHLEDVAKEAA